MALLERVISRLESEYLQAGKAELFQHARAFLMTGDDPIPHSAAAPALKLSEGALRVAVHRLRKRYREMLREEISATLSTPDGFEEELRSLQQALMSR